MNTQLTPSITFVCTSPVVFNAHYPHLYFMAGVVYVLRIKITDNKITTAFLCLLYSTMPVLHNKSIGKLIWPGKEMSYAFPSLYERIINLSGFSQILGSDCHYAGKNRTRMVVLSGLMAFLSPFVHQKMLSSYLF